MIDYPVEDPPVTIDRSVIDSPAGKRVVVLTLNNGDDRRPVSLGPLGLERLALALDDISSNSDDIDGVIVTGVGKIFCAGANLDTLSSPRSLDDALALAREGHRVLSLLSLLDVPTIAVINGVALGGGLELALHCSHRVAHTVNARMGLPEIGLGLIPGWGGATLLPRLVGMSSALRVMVDNAIAGRHLTADEAMEIGLIDGASENPVQLALLIVDGHARSNPNRSTIEDGEATTFVHDSLEKYIGRTGNPVDALSRLAAIVKGSLGATIDESFANEDRALAELMMTAEFRRRLYAFRVSSAAGKLPSGTPDVEPRAISRAGVVGAGLMASQIALALAEGLDVPVVFSDVAQDRLDAAMERMSGWLSERVSKGRLSDERRRAILDRLRPTLQLDDFFDCDLVIEAVFEDLTVKKTVFTSLEQIVRSDAILASNTSSLSIDAMAGFVAAPERVAGIHFFNPVGVMKLVEIVRGTHESDEILATAIDVARRLKKTPVIVADEPGFVVNRLLSTFLGETFRLVESGVKPAVISAALAPLRLPMNPFALVDLIGRTVTVKMMESLSASAPDRFFVGDLLPRLEAEPASSSIADDLDAQSIVERRMSETEIHDVIVDALSREVRIMLDTAVVSSASDIDICMMNGAGWPAAIGGMTPYLDGSGSSVRATGQLIHPNGDFA